MPSPIEPSVRAARLLDGLGSLSDLGPVDEARVRARLGPLSVKTVEEATRTGDLPPALDIEMAETVYRVAGEVSSHTGTVILEPREPRSPDAGWLVKWKRAERK